MYYYNTLYTKSDNVRTSRYTYNHAGDRIVKSHGDLEGVYINGAPQGITFHEHDEFTLYPASIISVNKNRFTKHYFIGSQRIASKLGSGQFNNVYGRNGCYVTAGQQDYAERINQIESQKEEYYKELGIPPGVPTMKGAYGDPENTGVGYNTIITELGDHSVPKNWAQYVVKRNPGETPGPPIIWSDPQNPEDAQPGYGFIPDDSGELEETFFYHSDHLGSTSYITDDKGNITQYTAYLPYGELLVDEHSSSENLPYKFNGKELDEATGLYYYGARYLQPVASVWYGVDPLMEDYPQNSPYTYCMDNPVKLIDFKGEEPVYNQKGKFLGNTSEGFTGDILIYSGIEKINFGKFSRKELEAKFPVDVDTYDNMRILNVGGMTKESHSRIWTHIVSQFEGMQVYDEKFTLSSVEGNKIGYEKAQDASWQTTFAINNPNIKPQIIGTGDYQYESTVENIASSIIVHEWYSHGKKYNRDDIKSHRLAYQNVINYKSLWDKTTDNYKKFNLQSFLNYTKRETRRSTVPPPYQRLYKKYIKK